MTVRDENVDAMRKFFSDFIKLISICFERVEVSNSLLLEREYITIELREPAFVQKYCTTGSMLGKAPCLISPLA